MIYFPPTHAALKKVYGDLLYNYDLSILLDLGADPLATMNVYGGEFTALELLTTSAHPAEAGVMETVKKVLTN